MALPKRLLRVTLTFQNGETVVLDETMHLRVSIEKNVLATQNKCDIEIVNLNVNTRSQLATQFTAWRNNQASQGNVVQQIVQVLVQAGYSFTNAPPITTVFVGEVAVCEFIAGPPNVSMRIQCFTRQCDNSKLITDPAPYSTSYKEYVQWALRQMNQNLLTGQKQMSLDFQVSDDIANAPVKNPAGSRYTVGALMYDIQDYYKPDVVAFIDDLTLVVRNKGNVIDKGRITYLTEFVGIPSWNEWGIEANVLFAPTLRLATAVNLTSSMNPAVNDRQYVVTGLHYTLASREEPFYIKFRAAPPASSVTASGS